MANQSDPQTHPLECPSCGCVIPVHGITAAERSRESHNHYMAAVQEAWNNLPENLAKRFPSPESLRKYALIRAGFCDTKSLTLDNARIANKVAVFMRTHDDGFSMVTARGPVVWVFTAKSQSLKAMKKDEFERSKTAVLDYLASLIGVTAKELENAEAI